MRSGLRRAAATTPIDSSLQGAREAASPAGADRSSATGGVGRWRPCVHDAGEEMETVGGLDGRPAPAAPGPFGAVQRARHLDPQLPGSHPRRRAAGTADKATAIGGRGERGGRGRGAARRRHG